MLETSSPQRHLDYRELLADFHRRTDRALALLDGFMPEIAWLDDVATLTYLHGTVSTVAHTVNVPEVPFFLDWLLADKDLNGGFEPMLGAHLSGPCPSPDFPTRRGRRCWMTLTI